MLTITPARPRMPRILLVAGVTIAAAAAVPSLAHGSTIHQDGRTPHRVLLQADPGGIGMDVANYFFATTGVDVAAIDCGGQLLDRAAVDIDAEGSIARCAEVTF